LSLWLFPFHIYPHNNSRVKLPYRTVFIAEQLITPPTPHQRFPSGKTTTSSSRHIRHQQFITIEKEEGNYPPPLTFGPFRCRVTLVLHVPPCLSVYTSRIKYTGWRTVWTSGRKSSIYTSSYFRKGEKKPIV
jgi:hypothetical protein